MFQPPAARIQGTQSPVGIEVSLGHATYRIWLKKPNCARMEATTVDHPEYSGVLVGDGD
jgi:hypothetical protein